MGIDSHVQLTRPKESEVWRYYSAAYQVIDRTMGNSSSCQKCRTLLRRYFYNHRLVPKLILLVGNFANALLVPPSPWWIIRGPCQRRAGTSCTPQLCQSSPQAPYRCCLSCSEKPHDLVSQSPQHHEKNSVNQLPQEPRAELKR